MKILVVGLGSIGQRHVRNIRSLLGNEAEFIAYRARGLDRVINEDMTMESHVSPAQKYNIRVFKSLDTAFAENPDAVLVTNPTSLHMPVALKAAENGCHLFIEKPLSNSLEGVHRLIDLVEGKGLVALVGYQMRYHPALHRVRNILNNCAIGRVVSARLEFGEYLPNAHPYEDYRDGYAARQELGGGVVLSLIHEIDYACWLFGMPNRAFAIGGQLSSLEMSAEDTANILLECQINEVRVPIQINLDFVQRPPRRTLQIVGDQGTVMWNYNTNNLRVYTASDEKWETHTFDGFQRNQLFMDEMRHFVRCIRGYEEPMATLRNDIGTLRVALSAKHSLESGKVVEINPWNTV